MAIAVALANLPDLLLADEPTGEVDEQTALNLYQLFRDLNRRLGLTIVIVSHDPHLAQHTDRVIAIRDGKVSSESKALGPDDGGEADGRRAVEELTVVDAAGRLQLPKALLEQYQIRRRVRLEAAEGGVLIRPVTPLPGDDGQGEASAEALIDALEESDQLGRHHARSWPLAALRAVQARLGRIVSLVNPRDE